jgi:hypothetical protein
MIQKETKICGKSVVIAYCYATEIGFCKLAGKPIEKFSPNNPEDAMYLIISSILSYYQWKDEEPPIKDEEIMYTAQPKEIIDTLAEIFKLRAQWYEVPLDEPKDEAKESDEKNA